MASEHFSLSWDNFHKNMSSGMNSLLENQDLVDVTLAVEGKYLKAHKMVLSVCSPYFRELFKVNPCQHPIVFMKDVSYMAMSDLLQFMYQGEVQVSQEHLNTFIKTAEALQIKGLMGDGHGSTECGIEKQMEKNDVDRPRVAQANPLDTQPTPVAKRPRLCAPVEQTITAIPAKTELFVTNTELIEFKMEPYEEGHTSSTWTDDNADDTCNDDPLDDTNDDDAKEDYGMMDSGYDAPQAGTSADGMSGEGQEIAEYKKAPISRKTKLHYEKAYHKFNNWRLEKNAEEITENVLYNYFLEKSVILKPSSLWAVFSMLNATIKSKENVDIRKFSKVLAFLKTKSVGYLPQQSKCFTREQIDRFLREANDEKYLLMKVVLIMGISGGCRRDELVELSIDSINDVGSCLFVQIPSKNRKKRRTFTVNELEHIVLYQKYAALRPSHATTRRFFLNYQSGKCFNKVVGIHKIGAMPSLIAKFLKLPLAETYNSHCFKRTSDMIIANKDITNIRQDEDEGY